MKPLYIAAQDGDITTVNELLNQGVDPNQSRPSDGNPSLHIAIAHNQIDIVKKLLAHNASLYLKDEYHNTALDIAVFHGNNKIINVILKYAKLRCLKSDSIMNHILTKEKLINNPNFSETFYSYSIFTPHVKKPIFFDDKKGHLVYGVRPRPCLL